MVWEFIMESNWFWVVLLIFLKEVFIKLGYFNIVGCECISFGERWREKRRGVGSLDGVLFVILGSRRWGGFYRF